MAIRKSHYWVAGAYLLVFVLIGIYMAHERELDKALDNFNKASIPQPSGSTVSTVTPPIHGSWSVASTEPEISTEAGALSMQTGNGFDPSEGVIPIAPPAPQQNWKHAEFETGGDFGSRLIVDGKTVETRSSDLRQVWYAPGWDAKRVDKVLDKIFHDSGGGLILNKIAQ